MQLELDRVLFVPVGVAPHRTLDDDPGPESRLEMVELAIADDERFTTSRIEMDREGPSSTETLASKETQDLIHAYYQLGERPRRRLLDLAKAMNGEIEA